MDITHATLKVDLSAGDEFYASGYNGTLTIEGEGSKVELTLPWELEDRGLVINQLIGCLEDIRAALPESVR